MNLPGELQQLWRTPVLTFRSTASGAYNEQLKELILRRQTDPGGTMIGVVDGDKTRSDLLRWPEPIIAPLKHWILDAATTMNTYAQCGTDSQGREVDMIAEAWAVVYQQWGYHNLHSHHDSAWSGVYYVHTGNITPGSGNIEFLDPRPAANAREAARIPLLAIPPEPGLMLMFPSWLQHWVTPYSGDSTRVCIAFNIGFKR